MDIYMYDISRAFLTKKFFVNFAWHFEVPPGNAGFGEQSAEKFLIKICKLEAQPLGEPENSDEESLGSFFYNEYDSDEEDRGN